MRFVRAPRQPDDRAARVLIPIRRAEPDEGGNDIDAVCVGDLCRVVFGVRRRIDDLKLVTEPLDRRAGDEDRAFEGVGDFALLKAPGDRRDEPVLRIFYLVADVHQHEAAGAVGILRLARREAGLAEKRRLLVARGAGDLHRRSEEGLVRFAVDGARRPHLGEHALRDIEFGEDLVVPFKFPYIIKQRARSV